MFELLFFLLAVFVLFIPTIIAFKRKLKRRIACLIVNILFGWTIIVWIPLLIWTMLTSATE